MSTLSCWLLSTVHHTVSLFDHYVPQNACWFLKHPIYLTPYSIVFRNDYRALYILYYANKTSYIPLSYKSYKRINWIIIQQYIWKATNMMKSCCCALCSDWTTLQFVCLTADQCEEYFNMFNKSAITMIEIVVLAELNVFFLVKHVWDTVHSCTFFTSLITVIHEVLHPCIHAVLHMLIHVPEVSKRIIGDLSINPLLVLLLTSKFQRSSHQHYSWICLVAVPPGVSQSVHSQLVRCVGPSSDWLAASLVRAMHWDKWRISNWELCWEDPLDRM